MADDELSRVRTALRWLTSHRNRLAIDRRSLEGQLARLAAEIERLDREIERAEERRREMTASREKR